MRSPQFQFCAEKFKRQLLHSFGIFALPAVARAVNAAQ
jgi:hypothetical protein